MKNGMPLGGLGTGKVEIFPDGRVGNVTIRNNWSKPIPSLKCFHIALHVRGENFSRGIFLQKMEDGVSNIYFQALFPRALLSFRLADIPLKVSLEAFSPIIPGDAMNSSLPVAIFILYAKNLSKRNVTLSVAMGLENIVGSSPIGRVNRSFRRISSHGIIFTSSKAKPEDPAFGDMALATAPTETTILGEYVCTRNREEVLEPWNEFLKTGKIPDFSPEDEVASLTENFGGILCVRKTLKSESEVKIPFVLSWHFAGKSYEYPFGRYYENFFNSSLEVAEYVLERLVVLRRRTLQLNKMIMSSSLPPWLKEALLNSLHVLVSNTWLTREGLLLFYEHPEYCPMVESLDARFYYSNALALFYPELELKTLKHIARYQSIDGWIPHNLGLNSLNMPNRGFYQLPPKDLNSMFILMAYRDYLWTGDKGFLEALYESISKAYEWLITTDKDRDFLPDNEGNDTTLYLWARGAESYTSSLYLAALKAIGEIAKVRGDSLLAKYVNERYERALRSFNEKLWAGDYYRHYYSKREISNEVVLGQLLGQLYAHVLGLGYIVERERIVKALKTIRNKSRSSRYGVLVDKMYLRSKGKPKIVNALKPHLIYALASQMILEGEVSEGLREAEATFATLKRLYGPWNSPKTLLVDEDESIGDHYPGILAIWNILLSLLGITIDQHARVLVLRPKVDYVRTPLVLLGRVMDILYSFRHQEMDFELRNFGETLNVTHLRLRSPQGKVVIELNEEERFTQKSTGEVSLKIGEIPSGTIRISIRKM